MVAKRPVVDGECAYAAQAVRECLNRSVANEDAGFPVNDGFGGTTLTQRHDGASAGLCLDRDHPEILDAGQESR